jgi:hypothetical protein
MSGMMGGDLAQLDVLRKTFVNQVEAVNALRSAVDGALGSTQWTGPAADRFRNEWASSFVPALQRLQAALTENSTVVSNRREAILAATH